MNKKEKTFAKFNEKRRQRARANASRRRLLRRRCRHVQRAGEQASGGHARGARG